MQMSQDISDSDSEAVSSQEEEEDGDFQASQKLVESPQESSSSEAEESKPEEAARAAMMKRKRKQVDAKKNGVLTPSGSKKLSKPKPKKAKKSIDPEEGESSSIIDEKSVSKKAEENSSKIAKTGKEQKMFNDKNVDLDLHKNLDSIISRRIRLNGNYILTCRTNQMQTSDGLTIDYASVVFEKRQRDGRLFEFQFPLDITGKVIEGLKEIMKNNPKYFATYN